MELGVPVVWRFCWPEKELRYDFVADLSGAAGQITAECEVQGQILALRGTLAGDRLTYSLTNNGGTELEVSLVAVGSGSFAGEWRNMKQQSRRAESAVLISERSGGQWNLYIRGQAVLYKSLPARVLQVVSLPQLCGR